MTFDLRLRYSGYSLPYISPLSTLSYSSFFVDFCLFHLSFLFFSLLSFPLSTFLIFLFLLLLFSSPYFSLIPLSTSLLFFFLLFLSLLLSLPFPLSNSLFYHSNSPFSLSLLLTFSFLYFLLFTYSPYLCLLFLYQYLFLLLFPSPTLKRILTSNQSQRPLNYSAYRHDPQFLLPNLTVILYI